MNHWAILWDQRDLLLDGFLNTLILFAGSTLGAALLGAVMAVGLRSGGTGGRALRAFVDGMRMLPFLLFVYLLYFGLPSYGIRLSAWTVGFIGLIVYHAAYVAEILRGAWTVLPVGQIEAAQACGYRRFALYREIILPQLVLQSGPVLGNQAIILLKDSAFLSIITVRELTAAASSIQSTYFIPYQALLVAIGFYWALSLLVEAATASLRRQALIRGLTT
jgi:polar amino acid transport system permease protein